jgi:hypothetical protein
MLLTDDLRAEVNTWGDVRYLIPPNALHHVFLEIGSAASERQGLCATRSAEEAQGSSI